jgi:DNA mismatch endonuclease (patch repair protein)
MAPKHRSHTMASVRGRDTAPEFVVRRIAHRLGLRFRLYRRDLPGCPDLVFPRLRSVIFVHGCFWHSHSCKKGRLRPVNNAALWKTKLEGNVMRYRSTVIRLKRMGWRVLTLWECQLKNQARLIEQLKRFLTSHGRQPARFKSPRKTAHRSGTVALKPSGSWKGKKEEDRGD